MALEVSRRNLLKLAGVAAVVVAVPTVLLSSEQRQNPKIVEIMYFDRKDGVDVITYTYHWPMPDGRLESLAPYRDQVPAHLVDAWNT